MSQNESLLDVVVLLYKWKKHILGAAFIVAVITALASLTMPNYYKAHTLFYAANPDLASPMPIGENPDKKFIYGTDSDLDRLFSIAKSNGLTSHLTEKFNLYEHYEINPDDPLARHKLSLKLQKLYNTTKTKYDAIDLSVEDKDPEFAALMANAAREKVNDLAQGIIKQSFEKQIKTFETGLKDKRKKYAMLIDSMNRSREKYGIFSSESQGESYSATLIDVEGAYLKASAALAMMEKSSGFPRDTIIKTRAKKAGLETQFNKLKKDIANFNKGYPIVKDLERITKDQNTQMNIDETRLASLKTSFNSDITAIHVIEEAEIPPYKSRPKRSYLVVGAAFLTTILLSLWVIIRDQYIKQGWGAAFKDN